MSESEKPDDSPDEPKSDEPKSDEPKLVVDTDWKEQVAREKQQAAAASQASPQQSPLEGQVGSEVASESSESSAPVEAGDAGSTEKLPDPPPASFEVLISMLFTQAMALLGQMPDPATGNTTVNKPYAKHYIDTLEMLGEKTKGNLSDTESKVLSEALHALRMMYVSAGK